MPSMTQFNVRCIGQRSSTDPSRCAPEKPPNLTAARQLSGTRFSTGQWTAVGSSIFGLASASTLTPRASRQSQEKGIASQSTAPLP